MPRHSKGKGKGATSATNPKPPAAPKPKRSSRRLSSSTAQSPQSPIRNGKAKQTKKRALEPNTPSATQPKTVRKTAQLPASAQSVGNNDLISSPKATIKDITVYGFSQHNKNAVCSVSLENCLVGDVCKVVQVTVRLTKGVNDALEKGQSPHLFVMQKTRGAIINARDKYNIDLSTGVGREYMISEWPWRFIWATAENELKCQEIVALENKDSVVSGLETRHKLLQ